MPGSPLFTIVIPTHNRAQLLKRAVQSVLDQTFDDWELIVVDDGSEDETAEVVASFVDARIRYVYQKHQERSTARNAGIKVAQGKYICFLDDDDYYLSHHLGSFQERIIEGNYPVAVLRTGMIIKSHQNLRKSAFYIAEKDKNPIRFFLNNMVGIHSLCFHANILAENSFDSRWYHFQDTHLLIRVLLDYPFYQIKMHTCVYVRHENMGSYQSLERADAEERVENNVNAIKDLFAVCGNRIYDFVPKDMEDFLIAQKYIGHAIGALGKSKRGLATRLFKKSINTQINMKLWKSYLRFCYQYLTTKA